MRQILRLSRRAKVVRNFLLALLLLAAVVLSLGMPALTKDGVFRQLQEAYLLTPSQLVYQIDLGWAKAYLFQGKGWITAGTVEKLDVGGAPITHNRGILTHVLPKDEMQAVILPLPASDGTTVVALWGAPEEAVTGELELTLEGVELPFGYENWPGYFVPERESFTAQGTRREDGWFFFELAPHPDETMCSMDAVWENTFLMEGAGSWPYRLTLWDEQGETVLEHSGATAEGFMIGLRRYR